MNRWYILFLPILFLNSTGALATDRVSTGTGSWTTPGTWSPSGLPVAGDNLTILSGHTITMNGNPGACANLTINGTVSWGTAGLITNVGGNLTLNNGGSITGSKTGVFNIAGTFSVPSGATASLGRVTISVTGLSTITGTLNITSNTGTKTLGAVTIASSGNLNNTAVSAMTINGNVNSAGTFNCNSGTFTVNGNFSESAGTVNFEGAIGGTLTVSSGATFNINTGNCSVTGLTTISGTISISTATGTKNFGNITVNTGGSWSSSVAENVTVTGSISTGGSWNCSAGTYAVSSNFSQTGGSTNFQGSIGGNLDISSGATFDGTTGVLTVTGSTTVSGTLKISTATGTKTFADITINSGGAWNCTVVESIAISGSLTNNGTFTSNTGTYTFSGAGKNFSGTVSFSTISISGTYTNNGTLTVGTALSGAGTLTQGAGSTLNIGGTSAITNLVANTVSNTVNYNGLANQTIKVVTYYDLLVSSTGGTVTFGAVNVNNNFTIASGVVSIAGVTMSVAGSTSISGTLNITNTTGTKTFNNVTVNSGGTWNAVAAEAFTINGNISNSGTFTANTGTYTLAGASKTISGTLSIPTISVSGSYTNNGTLTTATTLQGVGTFSQGATGTLNIGAIAANFSVATFNASAVGNTVNYNLAGAQSVKVPSDGSYHHLTLAGSGNKTLLGATDINGDLNISSVLVANNFNITLAGNWSNTGTFTPGTNTVTLDGAGAQTITKSGGETFNHLVLSGSGTKTLGSAITTSGNLTINSTLDISASNFGVTVKGNWANNGTFIYGTGTIIFGGTLAQTIGGTTTTDFYNMTQSNAAGVSLTHAQNLIHVLTISAGTFTTTGFTFTLKSNASGTASIAAIPSGANFAGNITMERYTGTGPTDWRFLCSPVSGATIAQWSDDFATSGFTGSTAPSSSFVSIYSYTESVPGVKDKGYVAATSTANSISNGKGYWVYLGPNPVTYEVVGPPNTFTVTPTVTYTSSGGVNEDGWNLIANPYPSAIDWSSASWTKTNIDNAIYIYNSHTGSFASYVGGLGVNGGSRYVASQQAIWVKANAANPVIKMVENIKVAQNPTHLKEAPQINVSHYPMAFKDFPIPFNSNPVTNSIKLTAHGNGFDDETFIQFKPGASTGFDGGFDAWKLWSLNPSCPNLSSIISDTIDASINSYSELTSDVTIPIRLTVSKTGTYSIRRDSILMLPMSSCVILEDLANDSMIDLRSNISYSFMIADTTSAPRFLLHIYAPVSKQAVNTHCSNDSSGMAIVKGTGSGPWNYTWKNAGDSIVRLANNSFEADTLFNVPVGIYHVEVSGSFCGIVSDTITVRSSSAMALASNFANVSCNGLGNGSAFVDLSEGVAPYTYSWNTGATTSALNNMVPGNYSVTASDASGCTLSQAFLISEPPVLVAGFTASTDTIDLSVNNVVAFTQTSSGATSCLWDFGDSTSQDTTLNPVHYYYSGGTYSVTLIASNGTCTDTSYGRIEVIDSVNTTGVAVQNAPSAFFAAYDHGEIFLVFDLPESKDVNLCVYNTLGEKILVQREENIKKDHVRIRIKDPRPGMYVLAVDMTGETIVRKFIIH